MCLFEHLNQPNFGLNNTMDLECDFLFVKHMADEGILEEPFENSHFIPQQSLVLS